MPESTLSTEAEEFIEDFLLSRKWTDAPVKVDKPKSQASQDKYQVRLSKARERNRRNYYLNKEKKRKLAEAKRPAATA